MKTLLLRMLLLSSLFPAPAALAVLVDDGLVNQTAPADDPGWAHVGWFGLNGVYVGYGWVLTAGHVPVNPGALFNLDGVDYPVMAASRVQFEHVPGTSADLAAFRIEPYPEQLALLPIRASTPAEDTEAVMIGRGQEQSTFNSWGPGGWNWAGTGPKRWGKNFIGGNVAYWPGTSVSIPMSYGSTITQSLVLEFNDAQNPAADPDPDPDPVQPISADEAIVALGDSGSGLFIRNETTDAWELAGIAWLVTQLNGQPASTSMYGNDSLYVDLSYYRDDVLAVVRPCDDGVDNDGDGQIDLADADCLWEGDMSELPACADGLDNDFDGSSDLADADCASADDRLEAPDQDGDLVEDSEDNCLFTANANQKDQDKDGYGTACDADFNNDGIVGSPDFSLLLANVGKVQGSPGWNGMFDLNGDGAIGLPDFVLTLGWFGTAPGPSGLACAGTVPCP